jgi:hypothetical protein
MSLLAMFFSAAAGIVAPVRRPLVRTHDAAQTISRFVRVLERLKRVGSPPLFPGAPGG